MAKTALCGKVKRSVMPTFSGSKVSQVPLSFSVPSGSVSPAAIRLAHCFCVAFFHMVNFPGLSHKISFVFRMGRVVSY